MAFYTINLNNMTTGIEENMVKHYLHMGLITQCNKYRRDSGIDRVSKRQVDWYMNNLLKRPDVSMVWACVEPDYVSTQDKLIALTMYTLLM